MIESGSVVVSILLSLLSLAAGHGPHHPRGSQAHHRPHNQKLTQDTELLQDQEHIKEDLGDWISDEQTKKMTPQELEFHYFKVHDFDNNTKLDGLEILQAIQHTMHSHDVALGAEEPTEEVKNDFQSYIELIDRVLEEDDLDKDGYLSYIEYVVGRQKDERGRGA